MNKVLIKLVEICLLVLLVQLSVVHGENIQSSRKLLEVDQEDLVDECEEGWKQELLNVMGEEDMNRTQHVHLQAHEAVDATETLTNLTLAQEEQLEFCYESCFMAEIIGANKTTAAGQVFYDCFPDVAPTARSAEFYGIEVAVNNLDCVEGCNDEYISL